MKLLVAIGFIALNFYVYNYLAREAVIPERKSFSEFPLDFGDWYCPSLVPMGADVERNLGVTDYLICDFRQRKRGNPVNVYVGYHATQVREEGGGSGENSIHPPAHCLPGSGWDVIRSETVLLESEAFAKSPAKVKRLLIARGKERNLVYYWYWSRGRVIAEDWKKILFVGLDRATLGRTDGSLVRFTVPVLREDEERADAAFRDLAPRVLALLPEYVPS